MPRSDLILLKDESQKAVKSNKLKYLLKAIPSGSTKTSSNEMHDPLISFSDMSTKIPDKSKPGSMKKNNPYKIEYFKNHKDACELSFTHKSCHHNSIDDSHKRSKSHASHSLKGKI